MKLSLLTALILVFTVGVYAQAPAPQWARGFGSVYAGSGPAIATDLSGNVYATGNFNGPSFTFGSTTLTNSAVDSAENMFLVKYDSSGNALWAKSAGGGADEVTENVSATGVGTDATGNVYVLGGFETPIAIFGTDTLVTNNTGQFLVKYNAQGNTIWAINEGGGTCNGYAIVVDAAGNSYIAGGFTGGSIIGGTDTVNMQSFVVEAYVIKYDSVGNSKWAAGIYGDVVLNDGVAIDALGNVYVTGQYSGDSVVISSSITLRNNGAGNGMYIVKYTAAGQAAWAQNVTVSNNIYPSGITVDAQGNVYVTGNTTADTLVFGADTAFTFSTSAASNIFVAAYDSTGGVKWAQCTQNNNNISSTGISVTPSGNLYVTGSFATSTVNIGGHTLTNSDTLFQPQSLFIAAYNAAGDITWTGGGLSAQGAFDAGMSALTDNNGHLYVAGNYAGPLVTFGNDTLPFAGSVAMQNNMFVVKYDISETGTGIIEPTGAGSIIVYPNPSTGAFFFNGLTPGSTLGVYDLLGRQVYTGMVTGSNTILNLASQAKGVYIYKATGAGGIEQQGKIVMQ